MSSARRIAALLPEPQDGVALDLLAMREGARELFGRDVELVAPTAEDAAEWSLDLGVAVADLESLLAEVTAGEGEGTGGRHEGAAGGGPGEAAGREGKVRA